MTGSGLKQWHQRNYKNTLLFSETICVDVTKYSTVESLVVIHAINVHVHSR